MATVTVDDLYENHAVQLDLTWVAGRYAGGRSISALGSHPETQRIVGDDLSTLETRRNPSLTPATKSLVGHLNIIHPNQIQVLGFSEIQYLNRLRKISREDAIRQLIGHEPDCIIVADDQIVPEELKITCESSGIPLLSSRLSSNQLTDDLHYYLSNLLAEVIVLHGVYMEIMSIGVLLTGESGVGKSELALELITRGHRLIADDAPEFSRIAPDIINGTCPKALADFLEVRGLGVLNIRELFGAGALRGNKYLRLIIRLERMKHEHLVSLDRLAGSYRLRKVLGLDIPEIVLPVAAGRNLAVLVECAARNHILRMSGYDSAQAFSEHQRSLIEQEFP